MRTLKSLRFEKHRIQWGVTVRAHSQQSRRSTQFFPAVDTDLAVMPIQYGAQGQLRTLARVLVKREPIAAVRAKTSSEASLPAWLTSGLLGLRPCTSAPLPVMTLLPNAQNVRHANARL